MATVCRDSHSNCLYGSILEVNVNINVAKTTTTYIVNEEADTIENIEGVVEKSVHRHQIACQQRHSQMFFKANKKQNKSVMQTTAGVL